MRAQLIVAAVGYLAAAFLFWRLRKAWRQIATLENEAHAYERHLSLAQERIRDLGGDPHINGVRIIEGNFRRD